MNCKDLRPGDRVKIPEYGGEWTKDFRTETKDMIFTMELDEDGYLGFYYHGFRDPDEDFPVDLVE